MATYCISYDLNRPGQNYNESFKAIKDLGTWWHYLDSPWIVETSYSASQVAERLRARLDESTASWSSVFVENLRAGLKQEAWDWITDYVPPC